MVREEFRDGLLSKQAHKIIVAKTQFCKENPINKQTALSNLKSERKERKVKHVTSQSQLLQNMNDIIKTFNMNSEGIITINDWIQLRVNQTKIPKQAS